MHACPTTVTTQFCSCRHATGGAEIIADSVAGSIRFWLSAGRGDFSLSPSNCSPTFYCIVFVPPKSPFDEIGDGVEGMRVKTSIIPPKDDYFATLKSTNYLPNALALMEAQDEDVDQVKSQPFLQPCWANANTSASTAQDGILHACSFAETGSLATMHARVLDVPRQLFPNLANVQAHQIQLLAPSYGHTLGH